MLMQLHNFEKEVIKARGEYKNEQYSSNSGAVPSANRNG